MTVATIVAAGAAVLAALIGLFNRQKISEIHVLVNSRMDSTVKELERVKNELKKEVGDRIRGDDDHHS